MDEATKQKINAVADRLALLCEDEPVIALAGAHAKGMADAASDLDMFVYCERPKPYAERKRLIEEFCDGPDSYFVTEGFDYPWGGSVDFRYQGTPVETVMRLLPQAEAIMAQCMDGRFEILPQTWTTNGYYTYMYLSEVTFLVPLRDSAGWLMQHKQALTLYPPKLKAAILDTFLGRAGTWIGNFHYASAIRRKDTLFLSPLILHTILDMIQVIFALNEVYYQGDKKLAGQLAAMPWCPPELLPNLDFLLSVQKEAAALERQAALLTNIYTELRRAAQKP